MIKMRKVANDGDTIEDSVTIGSGDFTAVLMPDGQFYEIAEIVTVSANGCRTVHHLTLAEESYYQRAQRRDAKGTNSADLVLKVSNGKRPVFSGLFRHSTVNTITDGSER